MTDAGAPPPVPSRRDPALDRRAVERVLARAAELQAARGGAVEAADLISESQLVEIAREVGLDATSVGQALAEERSRLPDAGNDAWVARTFGPRSVAAGRILPGAAPELLAMLDRWMQREECMQVQRRFPDRLVWEPRGDIWGMVRRGLGVGGRKYDLAKAGAVSATVLPLDGNRTLVTVEADLAPQRGTRLRGAAATTGSGAALSVMLLSLGIMLPVAALIPAAGGAGLGWIIARGHRGLAERMQLAVEQVLDRLEYGDARPPRTLAGVLESAARPLLR